MLSPDQAWETDGEHSWLEIIQEVAEHEAKNPDEGFPLAFRLGFKAGVKVADRDFCEKLKPEYRQN